MAQTGIAPASMAQCDTGMQTFMSNYQIPGATYAIAKNGKLVYLRAFGKANQAGTETTLPSHLFRIASLSKPITSIAIMKLIENGQLNLSDKVFGTNGILNSDPYFAGAGVTDTRVFNITIQHLLEHSAGWNRDLAMSPSPLPPYPYGYSHSDPIAFPLHVTQSLGEANPVSRRAMIKFLMKKGLNFAPGTAYNYSNIGFLILAEVIEKKSGLSYENYLKTNIFHPNGIYDTHLGKNLLADKREREAEYINTFTTLSLYGTGQTVPWQYGGFSVEAMDGHGGWISTARDLVRLITLVDGFSTRPDILSAASIQTMTAPSVNNANYAKGWQVNSANWWHTGSLDGSASIMVRTSGQFAWAIILNKRGDNNFFADLDAVPWNCVNSTTSYPTHDLFDVPTQNASAMTFSNVTSNSMNVGWTNGNGSGRVLIQRTGAAPDKFPADGTNYTAGQDLGGGNTVVYSGAGTSAALSNLTAGTNYQFRLYEYKKNTATGNYALYQIADPAAGSQNTSPQTFVVTRSDDRNATCIQGAAPDCSLREAVKAANAASSDDVITFDGSLQGQGAITLTSEIVINNAGTLTINGQNYSQAITGYFATRIFYINGATVNLRVLALERGNGVGATGSGSGGAIHVNGGSLTLDTVRLSGNNAANSGGAVTYNGGGNHLIINSTFEANYSDVCGAIAAFGTSTSKVTIVNSTISGNRGNGSGSEGTGGICNSRTMTVRNSTITDNVSKLGTAGGGIRNYAGGQINIGNTIIAGNRAAVNPEIFNQGVITSTGNNLIGDSAGDAAATSTAITYQTTDIRDKNPLLAPLIYADTLQFGAFTQTHALRKGSPAIDAGDNAKAINTFNNTSLTTDQRSSQRIVDGDGNGSATVDIGAFEVQTPPPPREFTVNITTDEPDANAFDNICDTNLTASGAQCSLRAAIEEAAYYSGNDRILFDLPANSTITLTNGAIQQTIAAHKAEHWK